MFQIEVPESKEEIDPTVIQSFQKECQSIVSTLEKGQESIKDEETFY